MLATGQTEGNVKIILVNKGEESVVFKKLVKYEDFPLSVTVTGEGDAVIKAYLDDVLEFDYPFVFTKEASE